MLAPKNKVLRSYHHCFYGREFDGDGELDRRVTAFLAEHGMTMYPLVQPGEWMWAGLTNAMRRSAFCIFETKSGNKNAHIELGYALAHSLRIALLIEQDREGDHDLSRSLPSDLAGLIQIRYRVRGDVEAMLSKAIPTDWYSVNQRLGDLLRQAGSLDRAYFWCLLQQTSSIEFLDLARRCHCLLSDSSEMTLATFLNAFDEALVIEGVTPPDSYPRATWTPAPWPGTIHQKIRIDEDYRLWISRFLAIEPGRPHSR